MKFAVKAPLGSGRARAGVLQLGSFPYPIETPALLLTTLKGLPLFIPPDHLPSLPSPHSHLLQFSPLHFLDGISPKTISDIGGVHQLLGLHQHIFVALPRDSIISLPEYESTNRTGPSFHTPGGRRLIKPAEYMEIVSAMKPDLWVTLADEVPAWVSNKRNTISVDRTLRWLDDCISLNKTGGTFFGSIVGGSWIEERQRCAQEVVKRNTSGYWIGGFGLGESMDERSALLTAVMVEENLIICILFMIYGVRIIYQRTSLDRFLDLNFQRRCCRELRLALIYLTPRMSVVYHSRNFSLFTGLIGKMMDNCQRFNRYIYHLTLGGFALTFPFETSIEEFPDYKLSDSGDIHTKINLKSTIYRKDASPIVGSCNCFTCQNHTKAYLNHLFNVHEMLAQTLLEIHNTHHYLGFFHSIREAIKEGNFEQFRGSFVGRRRDSVFTAALSA